MAIVVHRKVVDNFMADYSDEIFVFSAFCTSAPFSNFECILSIGSVSMPTIVGRASLWVSLERGWIECRIQLNLGH